MILLVTSASLLVFTFIIILFYHAALKADDKSRRINTIMGISKSSFDEELEKPFVQRFLIPTITSAMKNLSRLLPQNKGNETIKTERNLKLARINLTASEFNAAKLMFSGGFIIATIIIAIIIPIDFAIKVIMIIFSAVFSVVAPIYFIKFRINRRQEGIRNQLADVMDLLSVTVEAGLGFDSALSKIGERLSGPLVEELNVVLTEIQFGRPRRDALRNLAERSSVEELRTFVSSLVQAEQLGIPIKNVLRSLAQQMRTARRQRAEEKAMKAPVKMMIPMVALIFPVLFIILLGPSVLQIIKTLGFGGR
jgi:tight adherence protein C